MNDKYRVVLTLFHTGAGAIQRTYLYTCKHIVGGLTDLVFKLTFDKDYFSYSYRHSETTLQFIKDDMREILNCSTGYNHYDNLGNKHQDKSYTASNKIKIQIIENHANVVFLESYLDANQQRIVPPYLEIPLIENSDIKEDIEKELSYSLQEIVDKIVPIDTTNYLGNDIIESTTIFGTTFYDRGWGLIPEAHNSQWIQQGGGIRAAYPRQWLFVQGDSDSKIYATGEYWGELGGNPEEFRYVIYNEYETPLDEYALQKIGGFSILAKYPKRVKLQFTFNFYLKRKRYVQTNFGNRFYYSPNHIELKLYRTNSWSFMYGRDIWITNIQKRQEGEYDIYELKNFKYEYELDWYVQNYDYTNYGNFYIKFSEKIFWDTYRPQGNYTFHAGGWDWGIIPNLSNSKGYSFRADVTIDAVANSSLHAKNKISGIPILDYLSFISNKAGINISYPTLTAYGLNNIFYSSQNLLNFEDRQYNEENYLEIIEECKLKDVIDWLNNQFCLSIYIDENNNIILATRDSYTAPTREAIIEVNRLIEIKPQQFLKTIKAGSQKYELDFGSSYESMNTECIWELDTKLDGQTLDIYCNICTDPQFIDFMLMQKTVSGDKKCLIETTTSGGITELNVAEQTRITLNKTNETISNPLPNFSTWRERNFVNIFLSPLAQIQRWRRYITTPPQDFRYKVIKCDTNFITAINRNARALPYMQIYADSGLPIIFNNSNTIITGLPRYIEKVGVKIRDFDTNGYILPLKIKVQTPIYTQFINARRKALTRFTYNGEMLIGYPNEVATYFGEQVQEIEIELINTSTITNINDLIE